MSLSLPGCSGRSGGRLRPRVRRRFCAGSASISQACLQNRQLFADTSKIPVRVPGIRPWIACWHPHSLVNARRRTGWMPQGTQTPPAMPQTSRGRCGFTGNGLSTLSTLICLLTSSLLSSWRVICCRVQPLHRRWHRVFTVTPCRPLATIHVRKSFGLKAWLTG